MKQLVLGITVTIATLIATSLPLLAQGQATVLDPISPVEVEPVNKRPVIAADAQGNLMVVFWGERNGVYVLWSLRSSGGTWSGAEVPLPAGDERWYSFEIYDLAGRNGQFALLLKNAGHEHFSLWSGSAWSTPVRFPDQVDKPRELGFDATGNLVAWAPGAASYFSRLSGDTWQTIRLPQRQETSSLRCPPNRLLLGRTGALHLLGRTQRGVLMVGSCPPGADPMQPSSWIYQPPGYDPEHTGGASSEKRERGYALDWPRQTLWLCWQGVGRDDGGKIFVAHAPIGTTSEVGWTAWEIASPDRNINEQSIVSSGAGAVGVAYKAYAINEHELYFRWLPPTGLGEELAIIRPGSQTEAATFSTLYNNTLAVTAAPDGHAHLVIKGKKRGEYPENADRLYYSRITGGAVLQTEPGVTADGTVVAGGETGDAQAGGGQSDWRQQGGKPDLVPQLSFSRRPYMRDGREVYRFGYGNRVVAPQVAVRNIGSQYFGDVELDLIVDGAVIHYVRHDESGHMRPMIERDGTLNVYNLPSFRYEYSRPEQAWSAPELHLADNLRSQVVEMRSGLGRKTATLVIDPRNLIDEENEDNNTVEITFEVTDGRETADRLDLRDTRGDLLITGLNDLSIRNWTLHPNTRIAAPGLVQAPTTAQVLIANEGGATFFRDVDVAALIDGVEVWRTTIPLVDGEYRLHNEEVSAAGWPTAPERRGPDIRGGLLEVPVDLTNVSVGAHTLTIVVDPDDAVADLRRENNVAIIPLRVRERGGTVQVQVRDADTGHGVSQAHVLLGSLFFERADNAGRLTIADVPAGRYEAQDLWCSRPWPNPRYAGRPADGAFTVSNDQTTLVSASLEQPVAVYLQLMDAQSGQPVDAPPVARLEWTGATPWGPSDSGEVVGWRQGASRIVFPDVRPGPCAITAGAWGYEPATLQADVHRDARGECHLQMSLPQSPRGSVQVTVTDQDGRGVNGAYVFLHSAPRAAGTDARGVATLTEVEAGSSYTIGVHADDYTSGSTTSGVVAAGQTRACAVQIARVTSREKTISFDAVAWAHCESWPGFSFGPVSSDSYEVSAEHGKFHGTLGISYHEIAGTNRAVVDEVVAAFDGGPFWSENVTYKYSLSDLLCSAIGKVAGENIARLVKLAGPINDVYDWFNGDLDPNRLHEGEVVGTYTSWTDTEYASETLIPIPSITFSPGMSGGQTVVRTDMLEVTDGTNTAIVRRQWYSPSMMVYRIGEEFDMSKLEVKFFVAVLNERLSPGPLYASSRNLIQWKPMEGDGANAWVNFHPQAYDALGLN
ncbi:MAG: hypothetical protein ACOX9R_10960 [Armatimonadota bacterium]|jgi:hypothetical protein